MKVPYAVRAPHPSARLRSSLPLFVFLAYTAFFLTGFGSQLGALRPVPIYVFLCLLLLTVQENIAADRSPGHFLYIFLTSSFAIVYAGEVVFGIPALD